MINTANLINLPNARLLGEYSCGTYGSSTYNSTTCTGTSGSGGLLADTGYNVLLPLALGAALIIAAAILVVKRIRRRRATASK